jgi:hypothetical protein
VNNCTRNKNNKTPVCVSACVGEVSVCTGTVRSWGNRSFSWGCCVVEKIEISQRRQKIEIQHKITKLTPTRTQTDRDRDTGRMNIRTDKEYDDDSDGIDEGIIVLPEMDRITRPLLLKIQSADACIDIKCSRDVLEMRSAFFREIIDSAAEDSEIILMEDYPQAAARFLVHIHTLCFAPPPIQGRARSNEITWNKQWACLSVKWQMDGYIEAYSMLITRKLHDIVIASSQSGGCYFY